MRLDRTFVLFLCVLGAKPAIAEKSFPYKAYVTSKDVYVRSGPGENYYPTEKLQPGDEVEIYRHDPGGWYAIRPLPKSFSWVSGRYLKPGEDSLAEVVGDRVAARVGSQFSDIRDVVQARLERGEIVELLGTKQVGAGSSTVTWYKITPPSGEFRWVFGKYVDPDFPRDGVRKASAEESPILKRSRSTARSTAAKLSDAEKPNLAAASVGPQLAAPGAADANAVGPAAVSAQVSDVQPPRLPAASLRHISPEEFQAELDDVNTELSIMLAEEPTVWNCEELKQRTEALLQQAQTAVERGNAQALSRRLAQAEDIQRRFEAVNTLRLDTDHRNRQLAEIGRVRSETRQTQSTDSRFDGVGRLTRVAPSKAGAPRYALMDENGKVRCYVSPAPGVNMQYYLGRDVGVNGQRGYIAEGNAKHIMAKHVTALDSRLR